jgi:hypothetical protein
MKNPNRDVPRAPAWRRYLAAKSECVELSKARERNKRNAALVDAFRSDLRYAIRGLRARPGFAAAIIVMRQVVVLGGIGVALRGVLAFAAGNRIEPMLFKVSARDPYVFAFVIMAMLTVAVAASFFPARRAASVDPNVALRSE